MKLRISHLTRYQYDREVGFGPHLLYLRPREDSLRHLTRFHLVTDPPAKLVTTRDPYDNDLTWAYFWERGPALNLRTEIEITTRDTNPFDFIVTSPADRFPFTYEPDTASALVPHLTPPDEATRTALLDWMHTRFPQPPTETVPLLTALNQRIHTSFGYARREEDGTQTSLDTLLLGTGACRDLAVLFCDLARTLGLAARFVSGYLYTPPSETSVAENAMHAWVELYLPGAGWKGFDPTCGILCDDSYVPVAHSPLAAIVTPVQGSIASPHPARAQLHSAITIEKIG